MTCLGRREDVPSFVGGPLPHRRTTGRHCRYYLKRPEVVSINVCRRPAPLLPSMEIAGNGLPKDSATSQAKTPPIWRSNPRPNRNIPNLEANKWHRNDRLSMSVEVGRYVLQTYEHSPALCLYHGYKEKALVALSPLHLHPPGSI